MGAFDHLAGAKYVVVTTYKRDGRAIPTPVHVVIEGDHAYFRSWSTSGKAKRLRNNATISIAPSNARGKPTGPPMSASARALAPGDDQHVQKALTKKHPIIHGVLIPWVHRVRKHQTVHFEVSSDS